MLKILTVQSKTEQEKLCRLCGTEYDPDALAYSASVDGKPVGVCQFRFLSGCGYIISIANAVGITDIEALILMGRATLNFIDRCGVHAARAAKDAADKTLLAAVGFKRGTDGWFVDLNGFFDGHCSKK